PKPSGEYRFQTPSETVGRVRVITSSELKLGTGLLLDCWARLMNTLVVIKSRIAADLVMLLFIFSPQNRCDIRGTVWYQTVRFRRLQGKSNFKTLGKILFRFGDNERSRIPSRRHTKPMRTQDPVVYTDRCVENISSC